MPECGEVLTPLVERDEMAPAAGDRYMCSSCQLAFKVDATNALVETEP